MTVTTEDILVIHTASPHSVEAGSFLRSARRRAPLGAWCLAAGFPEKVRVLDLQDQHPDTLEKTDLAPFPTKAAIVLGAHLESEALNALGARLSGLIPALPLYLAGSSSHPVQPPWRGVIRGSGAGAIAAILGGELPEGEIAVDPSSGVLPSVPAASVGAVEVAAHYEAGAESLLGGPTLPVYQPWQGFLDQSGEPGAIPDWSWFARFLDWAVEAGYAAIDWRCACFSAGQVPDLAALHAARDLGLGLRWASPSALPDVSAFLPGQPWRLWLDIPLGSSDGLVAFEANVARFHAAGGRLGFVLDPTLVEDPRLWTMLPCAEEIRLQRVGTWPVALRRRLLWHFYIKLGRFPGKLLRLRTAYQLLRLLRQLYGILDAVMR